MFLLLLIGVLILILFPVVYAVIKMGPMLLYKDLKGTAMGTAIAWLFRQVLFFVLLMVALLLFCIVVG